MLTRFRSNRQLRRSGPIGIRVHASTNRHFDISKVEQWPTPWDLFSQTTFCINSQALGTFYTLLLSNHSKNHDIKLAIIEDVIQGEKSGNSAGQLFAKQTILFPAYC